MPKLKIGLIGCGGMGLGVHAMSHATDDRVQVTALCDIIESRAKEGKKKYFHSAKVYTDFNELLANADVDAVSPEEVLKMKAAAENSGKVLMVMRNNRFTEASVYAKDYIAQGKAGSIYAGRCGWIRRRGIPGKGGWFTTKELSGGGPLIDLGVHMIDLSIWLMGNPVPVAVTGAAYRKFADNDLSDSVHSKFGDKVEEGTFDVEDLAMGFIRFDNGACLQIEFSWASNIEKEKHFVELRGDKAGLCWENGSLKIFSEKKGKLTDEKPRFKASNGHMRNLRNFVDVVLEGAQPVFVPQQGVDMIKILDAVYRSAESGREIRLD